MFNSVGSITRALYSISRNVGSFDAGEERLSDPDNICSGLIFYGLGGFVAELGEGLVNCFCKPCKPTKHRGPGCCGRSVSGCLNLGCSPLTGALRFINAFSAGTSNCFVKKAPENERYRFPRQFGLKDELSPYEEGLAMGENCLRHDEDHQDEQIAYCKQVNNDSAVIITKKKEILVYRNEKCKAVFPADSVDAF